MFVSVDETENVHENEMRNFFKIRRNNTTTTLNGTRWQSILEEDNSKAFEVEITQTLINVNRFITKIEIESLKMNRITELGKEDEKKFKEYLALGRELLIKLKILATLEKASAMEKYEKPHVRKLSYAATEETASAADTASMMDGHGAMLASEDNFDRKDSRLITFMHKYAAIFTRHYEMFDKLNHDVEEIVERFNALLDFIHHELQGRSDFGANKVHVREEKNESSSIFTKKEQQPQPQPQPQQINVKDTNRPIRVKQFPDEEKMQYRYENEETEEEEDDAEAEEVHLSANVEAKSAVDIFSEHARNSTQTIIYKYIGISGAGHLVEHTYSCSFGELYCEGKARKKSKAKEEAAMKMIKHIMKMQKLNHLPPSITPFQESQILELHAKLSESEDFVEKLEETCLHAHQPPPLYSVLSESGKNNEPYYAVKCEAMGYTALGRASLKLQAEKSAAKFILNLVRKRRKSSY